MKTLILGSKGFVGSSLANSSEFQNIETLLCYRVKNNLCVLYKNKEFFFGNLNSANTLSQIIKRFNPETVINCIALADIGVCAENPNLADNINAKLPGKLARLANENKFKLIHFSTDAVYGQKGSLFLETDLPKPNTTYGKSKFSGEQKIMSILDDALILRIRPFGHDSKWRNLFDFFFRNLTQNRQVKGYQNVFFSPIAVSNIPFVLTSLINKKESGLFHATGNFRISKYEFGQLVARNFGLNDSLVLPEFYQDRNLIYDTSLNNSKLNTTIDFVHSLQNDLQLEQSLLCSRVNKEREN